MCWGIFITGYYIVDRWPHMTSEILIGIGSGNGLLTDGSHHYLNQWWLTVIWNLGDKFQWKLNKNTTDLMFTARKTLENIVCKCRSFCSGLSTFTLSATEDWPPRPTESWLFCVFSRNMAVWYWYPSWTLQRHDSDPDPERPYCVLPHLGTSQYSHLVFGSDV